MADQSKAMAAESTKRDPRVNPKAGDVLQIKGIAKRYVIGTVDGYVGFTHRKRNSPKETVGIAEWRKWSDWAEVIHAAE